MEHVPTVPLLYIHCNRLIMGLALVVRLPIVKYAILPILHNVPHVFQVIISNRMGLVYLHVLIVTVRLVIVQEYVLPVTSSMC